MYGYERENQNHFFCNINLKDIYNCIQILREKRLVIEDYDDVQWTPDLEKEYIKAKEDYKN